MSNTIDGLAADFKDKSINETLDVLFPTIEQVRADRKEAERIECEAAEHLWKTTKGDKALPYVSDRVRPEYIRNMRELGEDFLKYNRTLKERKLMTGYSCIDKPTRGLAPGEIMLIMARTSVGKSALGQNILHNMNKAGMVTVFFSLEQPKEQCYERWVQMDQGLAGWEIEEAFQNDLDESRRIIKAMAYNLPCCYVVDKPGLSLDDIRDYVVLAEELVIGVKVKCILIDYLGLLNSPMRVNSTYERISSIAKGMKDLAKDIDAGIIAIHQTSRQGGSGNERVTFDMARDSGVVEEAMDFIVGAWRPKTDGQNKINLGLLKNRRGSLKEKTLTFNRKTLEITEDLPF